MKNFIFSYLNDLKQLIDLLAIENISKAIAALKDTYINQRKIFVFGNGGSAATANHFVCDLGKNAIKDREKRFKIMSLCDNVSSITAYGNDIAYDSIFKEQLRNIVEYKDLIIAISASGNSTNILKAASYAKEKKGIVIGITGFSGGKLKDISDININVNSDSYEKIEDIHLIIMHIMVYWFKENQDFIGINI